MPRTNALDLAAYAALGLGLFATEGFAAAYIKFDGVSGESTHKDHKQWINVGSFSAAGMTYDGRTNRLTAENLRSGSAGHGTLTFSKTYDRSSARFAEYARTKRPIARVDVDICETEHSCVTYRLEDAVIERYSIAGDQEEITVSYPVIEWRVPASEPPRRAR
jgi:type VI secretion system secreted protein Hcp